MWLHKVQCFAVLENQLLILINTACCSIPLSKTSILENAFPSATSHFIAIGSIILWECIISPHQPLTCEYCFSPGPALLFASLVHLLFLVPFHCSHITLLSSLRIIESGRLEKTSNIQSSSPPTTNVSPPNRVPYYNIKHFLSTTSVPERTWIWDVVHRLSCVDSGSLFRYVIKYL